MTDTYRRILLATRPHGLVDADTLRIDDSAPVPEPADGQALVKVRYLSIDPTIRTWMDDAPGYLPPIGIGEVVRSGGIGEVVATRTDALSVGDTVFGMLGWQEFAVVGRRRRLDRRGAARDRPHGRPRGARGDRA